MGRTPPKNHESTPPPRVLADSGPAAVASPGPGAQSLRALRRLPPALRVAALEAALAHSMPAERHELASCLLEIALPSPFDDSPASVPLSERIRSLFRRSVDAEDVRELALAAVLRRWAVFPDDLREVALTLPKERWATSLSSAFTSEEPTSRLSAARFSREALSLPDPVGLASLVNDPDPEVAREAEAALVAIAAAHIAGDPTGLDRAGLIEQAVVQAAGGFGTHRRSGTVLAAILLSDRRALRARGSPLAKWFERESALGVGVSRGVLRSGNAGLFRLRAWEWVAEPRWTSACLLRLGRAETIDDHELTLNEWHLALNPRRSKALVAMFRSQSSSLLPSREVVRHLSPEARRGAMIISAEVPAPARERAELAESALADENIHVRLGAVNAAPGAALADLQFDPDERVARRAILLGSAVGESVARHGRVTEGAGESVRRAAALARSSRAMIASWGSQELSRLDLHARLSLAAMTQGAREAAADALTDLVGTGDDHSATQAVVAARRAGFTDEIVPVLIKRLSDVHTEPKLAATCVAALGDAVSSEAVGAIESTLRHAAPRVRANAVEAAAKHLSRAPVDADAIMKLVELKADPHHRVRANALRAWISSGVVPDEAWAGLHSMLTDINGASRLAAAWLAARVLPGARARIGPGKWDALAGCVQTMAMQDPNGRVRDRAFALADQLRAEWRTSWGAVRHEVAAPSARKKAWEEAA